MGLVNINTNTLGAVVTSGFLRPPYYSDLLTWHKGVDGITFDEQINNLPAKFLPRLADFNGITNNCIFNDNGALNPVGDFTWVFDYIPKSIGSNERIFATDTSLKGYELYNTSGKLLFRVYTAIGNEEHFLQTVSFTLGSRYKIAITKFNNTYTAYINEIAEPPVIYTAPILATGLDTYIASSRIPSFFHTMCMANLKMYSRALSLAEIQDIENVTSGLLVSIPDLTTGYDVSTNNQHIATVNVITDYDEIGTTYLNNNGYSLWQKTSNPDIQVPFDINGDPLSLTAGVDIPTGYTKSYDNPPLNNTWNMADCLIDLDPDDTLDAALDNFDRSNITIFTADARSGLDYDASNPYRFQITNLFNVEQNWKNVGYEFMVFLATIDNETNDILYLAQILNYATNKTVEEQLVINQHINNYINHLADELSTQF